MWYLGHNGRSRLSPSVSCLCREQQVKYWCTAVEVNFKTIFLVIIEIEPFDFWNQGDLKALCDVSVHHRGRRRGTNNSWLCIDLFCEGNTLSNLSANTNHGKGHRTNFSKVKKSVKMEPGKIHKWWDMRQ